MRVWQGHAWSDRQRQDFPLITIWANYSPH